MKTSRFAVVLITIAVVISILGRQGHYTWTDIFQFLSMWVVIELVRWILIKGRPWEGKENS
jgi:hypothetical protein